MAVVIINEAGIAQYFNAETSPWGRHLDRVAQRVQDRAESNAQDDIIGIQSHELLDGLGHRVEGTPFGAGASVGTTASHRDDVAKLEGFTYPGWHDTHGRAWLFGALDDFFPNARRLR